MFFISFFYILIKCIKFFYKKIETVFIVFEKLRRLFINWIQLKIPQSAKTPNLATNKQIKNRFSMSQK